MLLEVQVAHMPFVQVGVHMQLLAELYNKQICQGQIRHAFLA